MAYHDILFEKIYDLTELLDLTLAQERAFEQWREVAQEITLYAVQFRYPCDVLEPSKSDAETALRHTQAFVDFILDLVPGEVKPIRQ